MKNIITLVALLFISKSFAGVKFTCSVERMGKSIKIEKNYVVMSDLNIESNRQVASINENKIPSRTRFSGKSIEKIMYVSGEKYLLHINDINAYSEINDYLIIKSQKGHEMMFSVNCQ